MGNALIGDSKHLTILRRALQRLRRWYAATARNLPWRRSRDPYAIWVSELMLQQTQVTTVIPYFERWLERFPTISDLAGADDAEVLRLWQGLGYYRRARWLHQAARLIVAEHAGEIPTDPVQLGALPGVGRYTVAAVLSIAHGLPLAAVDGNVRRVLARVFALEMPVDQGAGADRIDTLATSLLYRQDPGLHNQAMMELGARVCSPRRPRCSECPLVTACRGAASGDPARLPVKTPSRVVPHQHLVVAVAFDARGSLLLYQRPYGGLLAGLWDLPALPVKPDSQGSIDASDLPTHVRCAYGVSLKLGSALPPVRHAYSHLKVTLHPFVCHPTRRAINAGSAIRAADCTTARWVAADHLDRYAMPRAGQKVLELWAAETATGETAPT